MANASILSIVVSKLRHGKKSYPIILLKVDKSLEVGFHGTIMPLNLAIRLQVKDGGEFLLDAEEIV